MWRRSIVLPCALLALGSAGLPQENAAGILGGNAVLARQAGMDMSLLTIRSIEAFMKAGGEAKNQGFPAAVLAKWAKALPPMFPAGTAKGETSVETQALPALSKDHAGFERAAAYYAAAALDEGDDDMPAIASLAKACAAEAYLQTAIHAVQMHGGIGFTWDNDTHLWFKRAKSSEILFGDANQHRELMMQHWTH